MNPSSRSVSRCLKGVHILSLALNLPGPAALMRCKAMGAVCVKLEPPVPAGAPAGARGDPMSQYNQAAYAALHRGVRTLSADLKTEGGQKLLHRELAKADILLTSFRPSALPRLGLGWPQLHRRYPALSQIAIVGGSGERAEEAGHDLTYLAENDLVTGLDLPPTLYADMGGSLVAVNAVLQAVLQQRTTGKGRLIETSLSEAAAWLALPRLWGLTRPQGFVGGAHAGYRVYACKNGRVAVAALEPHFALRLCAAAGLDAAKAQSMRSTVTHQAIAAFMLTKTRQQLEKLAREKDIPLQTLSAAAVTAKI